MEIGGIRLKDLSGMDVVFVLLRFLTVFGGGGWLYFHPNLLRPQELKLLFLGFSLYSILIYGIILRFPGAVLRVYRVSGLLDLVFLTGLVWLTGGVHSEFYLGYYLLVALHAFYFSSLRTGLLLAAGAAALYILANLDTLPGVYWGNVVLRVTLLFLVGYSTGIMARQLRRSYRQLQEYATRIREANEALEGRLGQITALYEASKALNALLQLDQILSMIVDITSEMLHSPVVYILLWDDEERKLTFHTWKGLPEDLVRHVNLEAGEGIAGRVFASGQPMLVPDLQLHPGSAQREIDRAGNLHSLLAVPLRVEQRVAGVLNISRPTPGSYNQEDLQLLSVIASLASAALEKARLYEMTEKMAITDGLTGLFNYRYFRGELEREVQRSERYGSSLSLLMVDIDHFKRINDTYGHPRGDIILREIARIIKASMRQTDLVARYGGEEFGIILPEISHSGARVAAERLRKAVQKTAFRDEKGNPLDPVTVSIGVASYPANAGSAEDLIKAADQALYQAKLAGRNRVWLAPVAILRPTTEAGP